MNDNFAADVGTPSVASPWAAAARKVAFFGVLLAAYIGAQLGRIWPIRHAAPGGKDWVALGLALLFAAALLGIYVGLVRSLERRAPRELAPAPLLTMGGIILGLALFSSVFGLLHAIGVARWLGISSHFDAIPMLAVAILAAVGEELAFRGGLFRLLEERLGTAIALAISAIRWLPMPRRAVRSMA